MHKKNPTLPMPTQSDQQQVLHTYQHQHVLE